MSRADRPYGSFDHPRAEPGAAPAPPRALPSRVRAVARGLRDGAALVVGLGMILVALSLIYAPPAPLTLQDVDGAVQRALASASPSPPPGVGIWERTRHSVVQVRVSIGVDGRAGAGVVIDQQGTILTNEHVIRGATRITVGWSDGTESVADVVQAMPENDVAVLVPRSVPPVVVPAVLGDPRTLRVGDEAYAIGDPLGLPRSLSAGVISGLDRTFQARYNGPTLTRLIQFDAAVNPGSSGGPLLNRDGDVVGIVTGLANPMHIEAFSGIGFAVPIDVATSAGGPPVH